MFLFLINLWNSDQLLQICMILIFFFFFFFFKFYSPSYLEWLRSYFGTLDDIINDDGTFNFLNY